MNRYRANLYASRGLLGAVFLAVCYMTLIAGSPVSARDIFSGIVPNDKYFLTRNGAITNGDDCLDANGNPVCNGTTGYEDINGTSHQYVTIGGSINDDNGSSNEENFYEKIFLNVFMTGLDGLSPETKIPINFDLYLTNRGIQAQRACNGYSLRMVVIGESTSNQDGILVNDEQEVKRKIVAPSSGICSDLGATEFNFTGSKAIPVEYFKKLSGDQGYAGNQYSLTVMVAMALPGKGDTNDKQASFHLRTSRGNIGYKKTESVANDYYWVNTYPTKNSTDHKIKYYFRPPCQGERDIAIQFMDFGHPLQQQNISIQVNRITPNGRDTSDVQGRIDFDYTLWRDAFSGTAVSGSSNQLSINTNNRNSGEISFTGEDDANGIPYGYVLIIDNVAGGNGISVSYPEDSANLWLKCADQKGWEVDNASRNELPFVSFERAALPAVPDVEKPEGDNDGSPPDYTQGMDCNVYPSAQSPSSRRQRCITWNQYYTDRQAAWSANTLRVRSALQKTEFSHRVTNKSSAGQESWSTAQTRSIVQYKFKLAGGNDRNGNNGNTSWRNRYDNAIYSNTIPESVTQLVTNPDAPVLISHNNETYNEMMREPRGDGGAANSDMYCERVVTFRSGNPGEPNTNDLDSIRHSTSSDRFTASQPQCVYLNACAPGAPSCSDPCREWSVRPISRIYEIDRAGAGSPEAAWVGDRYGFRYDFEKSGSAATTSQIAFTYKNNGVDQDEGSRTLGAWGKSYPLQTIRPQDAGRSFTSSMDYTPARSGDPNNCGSTGSETAGPHSVTVPYFFSAQSNIEVPSSYEQGDEIAPEVTYSMPKGDGGRDYTWTDNSTYQVTQLIYEKGYAPPTKDAVSTDAQNLCADASYVTDAAKVRCSTPIGQSAPNTLDDYIVSTDDGATHLMPTNGAQQPMGQVPATLDTNTLPAGTKVCFVASLSRPTQNASPSWYHSAMDCTTIVKKPKVQFLGGDLTVGRAPAQGSAGECPGNPGAIIQTAAATVNTDNIYGSWVEFGAFAPGVISRFGSGAYPAKRGDTSLTKDAYKKLLFANTFTGSATQTPGRYAYAAGAECLSNAFNMVDLGNVNLIGDKDGVVPQGDTYTLVPGNYFARPGKNTRDYDKTGYVTSPGKNLVLGQPVTTNGGAIDSPATDSATTGGSFTLPRQCSGETTSAPAGWAQATSPSHNYMYFNSGCNGFGGNYLTAYWVEHGDVGAAILGGDYAKWRYTPPENTTIESIGADVKTTLGRSAFSYEDLFIDLGADDCTAFYQDNQLKSCPDTRSYRDNDIDLQGESQYTFGVRCSTNSGATHCRTNTQRTTGVGFANIDIGLKDMKAPVISSITAGGLYKNNNATPGKIGGDSDVSMTINASDSESGLESYQLMYKPANQDQWVTLRTGNFGSSSSASIAINPQAVFGFGTKGVYPFKLFVYDKSGNHSAATAWTKEVDNSLSLDADYSALSGRNIVVYARKDPSKSCQEAGAGGTMTISDNITYKTEGYASIADLPRVIFMADCNIVINDNVTQIDAWLIAGNDVRTCGQETYQKFRDGTATEADCATQLAVNGAVQARRLVLLRTYGADQVAAPGLAETFNLRSEQLISTWVQGQTSGVTRPIYETELPPRW